VKPALELRGLKKSFGGVPAINGVSLEVMPGERRLIIGPNGAGKTTLFNLITGDLPRDGGAVRLFGEEVSRLKTHQRAHRGLARTYQIITLFAKDSLEHNIALSLLGLSRLRWSMFAPLTRHEQVYAEARRILELVGLRHLAQRPISEVSYGEKRRVEIAMALAQDTPIVLLDEPFRGLDRETRRRLLARIRARWVDATLLAATSSSGPSCAISARAFSSAASDSRDASTLSRFASMRCHRAESPASRRASALAASLAATAPRRRVIEARSAASDSNDSVLPCTAAFASARAACVTAMSSACRPRR